MTTQHTLIIFVALLVLLGCVFVWMGIRRLTRGRLLGGAVNFLVGAALVALGVGTVGVSANLYTYQRLTGEQAVGTLVFERYAPQEYVATLKRADNLSMNFSIHGDECQLDARILKWKGFGTLMGLDTLYRLEKIGGRFRSAEDERGKARSLYTLSENPGIEFWGLVNRFNQWIPWVDAIYGNAVYVPMAGGAEFAISVTASGLIARPANRAAEQAIKRWQ